MATTYNDFDDLRISEEAFSSLYEEINQYTPKSPLNPAFRTGTGAARGRSSQGRASYSGASTAARSNSGQTSRNARQNAVRSQNTPAWQTPDNSEFLRSAGTTPKGSKSARTSKIRIPSGVLKFVFVIVFIAVLIRACGLKDHAESPAQIPQETESAVVDEPVVYGLTFTSDYLKTHGDEEALGRVSSLLGCEPFSRTEQGELFIETEKDLLDDQVNHYLRDVLPTAAKNSEFPNFVEISADSDFSELVVVVSAVNLYPHEQNYTRDLLLIAQIHAELNGAPNEEISIVFRNMLGNELSRISTAEAA